MFNFFSKIFFIVGIFVLLTQSAQAGNTTNLNNGSCNPQGILDYSSLNIPSGTVCTILPVSQGAPGADPAQPPINGSGSTQTISFTQSGNFTYSFSCPGLAAQPDQATFNVTIPASCNSTGTYSISASPNPVQICSPQTQGSSMISWSAPSGQSVNVYVNGSLFGSTSGSGSQNAPWIQTGQNSLFELKKANSSTVEASVTVTGTTSGCSNNPPGYCGDSQTQTPNGQGVNEQCDLGLQNGQPGSGCSSTCQTATLPPSGYKCSSNQCAACGGSTGVACDGSGDGCSAVGQSCGGPTCGNGTINPGEQCGEPGLSCGGGDSCVACQCYTPGTPTIDAGFTVGMFAYAKNKSVQLLAGQTTHTETVNVTSSDVQTNFYCNLEKNSGSGWQLVAGSISPNTSTSRSVANLPVGAHDFRYVCGNGANVSSTATLSVTATPSGTTMDIGWSSSYSPKSKSVTVASGGTSNESLYITTGGRSGCSLSGYMNSGNQSGVNPVSTTAGFAYVVNAPQSASAYTYTLSCFGQTPVSATLNVTSGTPAAGFKCSSNQCIACGGSTGIDCDGSGSGCSAVGQSCGGGGPGTGWTCSPAGSTGPCTLVACGGGNGEPECSDFFQTESACQQLTSCGDNSCGNGICNASCPQNCTTDAAECVGGQATIVSPVNQRVLSGQPFTVNFSFRNIGNTSWSNPTYQITTTGSTYAPWRTVFGTRALSPSPIAGTLGGSGSTNLYSQIFNAPVVSGQTTYTLGFAITKNNVGFNSQCLVNGNGQVTVHVPQCNDSVDNDGDGAIDCGIAAEKGNPPIPADPGCFPDGNGGGGACNVNDDNETNDTGANMSISANPQLVRQGGTSNVTFTCDAGTWSITGPQVANITGLTRDTTSLGCNDANVFCGTEAVTGKIFPATNVQVKETYTLRCSGRERSATISVIKINEI